MLATTLQYIMAGHDLDRQQARDLLQSFLAGQVDEAPMAALLVALAMKGETVEEVVGFAQAMRAAAQPFRLMEKDGHHAAGHSAADETFLVDTCGTGGDASGTFNISTAAAIVAAGAGLRVAKHGNRSISSHCGSADVMEALGVNLSLPLESLRQCLDQVGMVFLFAPHLHLAMRYVQPVRRQLRVRTVFNLLGPLTNPAQARAQVVGVYSPALTQTLAQALGELGVERAFVVHGEDGLDEITTTGDTLVAELRQGKVTSYKLDARQYGIPRAQASDLAGGNAQENAKAMVEVLEGKPGSKLDIVLLNSAAVLVAGGRAPGLQEGLQLARASIESGQARQKLRQLAEFTQQARVNSL